MVLHLKLSEAKEGDPMYVILEYATYVAIVSVLAGLLFGASALVMITKDKAPHVVEASLKAIHDTARRLEATHLPSPFAKHSAAKESPVENRQA